MKSNFSKATERADLTIEAADVAVNSPESIITNEGSSPFADRKP